MTLREDKLREIEEYYDKCASLGASEEQIEESQKAVAHLDAIIGDPDRLKAVAKDFVLHYEKRVEEGSTVAGKAMFVCANRLIAYAFYLNLMELRPEWKEKRKARGCGINGERGKGIKTHRKSPPCHDKK